MNIIDIWLAANSFRFFPLDDFSRSKSFFSILSFRLPDGHFRHILLYYFRKGKKAVQLQEKLYDVYSEKSLTEHECQNWFARFRSGDFDLKYHITYMR